MSLINALLTSGKIITGNTLVVNGMSIMAGVGASPGNGFVDHLCDIKGWTADNNAVSGTTVDDLLSNLSLVPAYDSEEHRYWLCGYTINDTGFQTSTPTTYKPKLTALFEHVHTVKGWPKYRMRVIDGFDVRPWNFESYEVEPDATLADYDLMVAANAEACDAFGIRHINLVPYMRTNFAFDAAYDEYGRHPVDATTLAIAEYTAPMLR